jgi:hypothetical protein
MLQGIVHPARHLRLLQLGHRTRDQLSIGQQPELLEELIELLDHSLERVVELLE